ncbi:MAG: 3-isopropylmalate dehydratase [Spirochaetes bacterium]|nr:3-isopropylmalate dehydratase [Spirochaetota bacterium]
MIVEGRVAWIFPDNFDADFIVGVENISTTDTEILKAAVMKNYEPDFTQKIKEGDIIVAGKNFGYGHPHPQPMIGLRGWGINVVIAESFFHVFYRGEIASGSKMFVSPGITKNVERWDELHLDTEKAILINKTKNKEIAIDPIGKYPLYLMEHNVMEFIHAIKSGAIT